MTTSLYNMTHPKIPYFVSRSKTGITPSDSQTLRFSAIHTTIYYDYAKTLINRIPIISEFFGNDEFTAEEQESY